MTVDDTPSHLFLEGHKKAGQDFCLFPHTQRCICEQDQNSLAVWSQGAERHIPLIPFDTEPMILLDTATLESSAPGRIASHQTSLGRPLPHAEPRKLSRGGAAAAKETCAHLPEITAGCCFSSGRCQQSLSRRDRGSKVASLHKAKHRITPRTPLLPPTGALELLEERTLWKTAFSLSLAPLNANQRRRLKIPSKAGVRTADRENGGAERLRLPGRKRDWRGVPQEPLAGLARSENEVPNPLSQGDCRCSPRGRRATLYRGT